MDATEARKFLENKPVNELSDREAIRMAELAMGELPEITEMFDVGDEVIIHISDTPTTITKVESVEGMYFKIGGMYSYMEFHRLSGIPRGGAGRTDPIVKRSNPEDIRICRHNAYLEVITNFVNGDETQRIDTDKLRRMVDILAED